MKVLAIAGIAVLSCQFVLCQDADRDFSGAWRLNPARSDIRSRFDIPTGFLRISQNSTTMTVLAAEQEGEQTTNLVYGAAGKSERSQAQGLTFNIVTKWEGTALLASVIVGGQADYNMSERWVRSRDGSRLTITRTIEGRGSQVESTFEYDSPGTAPEPPRISETRPRPQGLRTPESAPAAAAGDYVLAPGTRILLRLTNSVNTERSVPGDKIYLQTAVPVFLDGRVIIPQGSYVTGSITESQRPGRVKGKAGLNFRFETLTLPNGVARDFLSRAGTVDAQGSLDRNEGRITGDGTKGKDAATVAQTTAAGTGIGTIAGAAGGNLAMGMGIGAAAGAVAGLAGVFGSRGKEVVIPQGTTMELVLDRELRYTDAELSGQVR